jgi:predicted Zn-dependent peptidase
MSQPTAARPVFSTEDFRLIRKAVAEYIREHQDDQDAPKFVNLHHRLGRFG